MGEEKKLNRLNNLLPNMVASAGTVSLAVAVFNPLDCLRIRWQVAETDLRFSVYARRLIVQEGLVRGLWRPGLVANIAGSAVCRGIGESS